MSRSSTFPAPAVADAHRERADRIGELFDAHRERLYRLARRISRDADEALDLVQDTFLRLARQRGAIPATEGRAEAWLVTTLVRLCRDRERRLRVRRRFAARPEPESSAGATEDRAVARIWVQAGLAGLSPRRRAIVALHDLEGKSAGEIAGLLGLAPVTVRWHLHVAHRELRRTLLRGVER